MARCFFRDQHITDDDLLAFSRRFGDLDPPPIQEHGRQSPEGYPDIYVVSNVLDDKGAPIGALGAGEAVWHTDMSYLALPPDASMLYSLEVPPDRRRHLGARHAGRLGDAARCAEGQGARPPHQARRHLQFGRLPAQRRDPDRRSAQGAGRLASGGDQPPGNRRAVALSGTPAQFVCGRSLAGRLRCAARCALGAYRAAGSCATSTAGASAICCCGTTAPPCTGAIRSTTRRAASCIARRSRARPPRASGSRRPNRASA